MRNKIYLKGKTNEADRLAAAAILLKAGYTVRISKEKRPGEKTYTFFIEYWEETESDK